MRTVSNCLTEINNTQKDNAKDLHVVMPMYNLVECSDNYSRTFGSLHQFCRDEPHAGIVDTKMVVSLKYLNSFWRTLEIDLINCEIHLIIALSKNVSFLKVIES